MDTFIKKTYQVTVNLMNAVYLGILWIVFTVLGGILFGLFPATTAMFSVTRKWVQGDLDIPIFLTFWKTYKEKFIESNKLCWVLLISAYLLIVGNNILSGHTNIGGIIARYMILGLLLFLVIMVLYFFPFYTYFEIADKKDYYKWPLVVGIRYPILTIVLVGLLSVLFYVFMKYLSMLVLILGVPTIAIVLSWAFKKVIPYFTVQSD